MTSSPSLDSNYRTSVTDFDCREVYSDFFFIRTDVKEGEEKAEIDKPINEQDRVPFRCQSWNCGWCKHFLAEKLKNEIGRVAEEKNLRRFVTLTLSRPNRSGARGKRWTYKYIQECFEKLRIYLRREFKETVEFIRVSEPQKDGTAHFHLLLDRYIPQKWLSETWKACGGGEIVDVRYVDINRVKSYLTKYLTKEGLFSVPRGIRRYSHSRTIRLFVRRGRAGEWILGVEDTIFDSARFVRGVKPWDFTEARVKAGLISKPPPNKEMVMTRGQTHFYTWIM